VHTHLKHAHDRLRAVTTEEAAEEARPRVRQFRECLPLDGRDGQPEGEVELTPRRQEVLKLMAGSQLKYADMARKLEINEGAVKNYVPRPYGGCVTLFRSRRQHTVSSHDSEMGWGRLARGGLKVVVIPGDHGDLLDEPFVGVLAPKLQACLDEARAND